jgi:hypothetical protein
VTITAGGGLSGATGVQLFSTGVLGANQGTVTCTVQPGGTDTSLTARCSSTATVASATRVFRVTLGGTNSGTIATGNVTVVQQ